MAVKIQTGQAIPQSAPAMKIAQKIVPEMRWERPEPAYSWYLNSHCSCGCRLSTNNKDVWCSSVFHEWHESKENFMLKIKKVNRDGSIYFLRFV